MDTPADHSAPRAPAASRTAVCTIVSKNYLSYARVLSHSLAERHPELERFVLLVDDVDGCFDPAAEPFTLVRLADLAIPNLTGMCFQYDVLELNTAVKPFLLTYLFERLGFAKALYFDPDILILGDLGPVLARLDAASVVLTPHLTAPLPDDGRVPSEIHILQAGTYNLGFIGLRAGATTRALLQWWEARLADRCQMAVERGMHVDQKWIDLVPGFFDDVVVLRDPTCNVAYWNAPHRKIARAGDRWLVDGMPCTFFHFSGFDPELPGVVSKHQNRLTMADLGDGAALYARYRQLLLAAEFSTVRRWPYRFARFDNGVRVPRAARRLYLGLGDRARRFGDPFETTPAHSFYRWLNERVDERTDIVVTRLWHGIHALTPAIAAAFPDVLGLDRLSFANWSARHGGDQQGVDVQLIPELVDAEGRPADAGMRFRRRAYRRAVEPLLPVLKPLVRRTIARNPQVWDRIVTTRMRLTGDPRFRSPAPATARPTRGFGVNVAGYVQSEKGVGEAMRSELRSLEAAGIPYVVNNFVDHYSDNRDDSVDHRQENPHPVNLVHVNADQVVHFAATNGVRYFQHRYNVGHWVWELAQFPDEYRRAFDFFDEVWVPTAFAQDAIARVAPVPVVRVPYSIAPRPPTTRTRAQFGWPPERYVFLFMFDFSSYLGRKNPLALLQAFAAAFTPRDEVLLVMKCVHPEIAPKAWESFCEAAHVPNVMIMSDILPREEIDALMQLADCYVSLHRSEGFGLTIAEAMSHGKPAIATGYSGNMDFMTAANSLAVRHRLIELDADHGPYRRGMVWADPDLDHAAELMRWVYTNRELAAAIGERARQDLRAAYAPSATGKLVRARLEHIATRAGIAF
jgi:glycosyltransferase involved in cell wall biosynthesis